MSYTLIGSQTSPFVRRLRILMEAIPFEFRELSIFETEDALTLNKINPINQVPVLLDGDQKIWDSRQIFNYLNLKHKLYELDWDEQNVLTAVESAMSSGIALLLMKRSGMNVDEPLMYVDRQKERIESILNFISLYLKNKGIKEWSFITMTIYCFLDWGTFRGILNLDKRPECKLFLEAHAQRAIVLRTQIPKA